MQREFNITGTCIPEKHYMVDISGKLKEIMVLIEKGNYFTINRPRQYGKTTTQFFLEKILEKREDYLIARISFEGVGDSVFANEEVFGKKVIEFIADRISAEEEIRNKLYESIHNISSINTLSKEITKFCESIKKKFVLLIDEVDKSSNNQLFLSFLGMLRNKYLLRNEGRDSTFHSVILAGVHDVKTLKLKLRPGEEQKYNSPWNIATDFKVDMSFNPQEISTMLVDYSKDKKIKMDITKIAERIYHYTSGYPFLVSKICKEIDENILPEKERTEWSVKEVERAVKTITLGEESNTNFDSIIKNIENDSALGDFVLNLLLGSTEYSFLYNVPLIYNAVTHGIIKNEKGKAKIHNKIYEEYLTNYFVIKLKTENKSIFSSFDVVQSSYIKPTGKLEIEKVLLKFQEVIKEKYSQSEALKSDEFLEKELRMRFFCFIQPIMNGIGFAFKEVETGEEKRIDVVIIFRDEKFVVELKLWRGMKYHRQGIKRLKDYMKKEGVKKGYMLIADKTRHKQFKVEKQEGLMMVWI
ncbi:MAG: AAA family ATPase [Bacteroidetes bacterium RIFCSPLOWO2_02_FULL_36_8]|nr:MAG: AAA family ATPase [Bacteroidetes bacterium RIFCSPLOWO2_02_FULL_36_8]OFY71271.1 MAG: AAA family ATPase [Bacteroidetes bacterium RIFCSPLOWO2_12_FULL_37_12]